MYTAQQRLKSSLAVIGMLLIVTVQETVAADHWMVSIPQLSLAEGERVGGFDITLNAGSIKALPKVPRGWHLIIDNDPSWKTRISGTLEVGAAALKGEFFKDFLVVEEMPKLGLKEESTVDIFDIKVEIVTTIDFEKDERRLLFGKQDLLLHEPQEPNR